MLGQSPPQYQSVTVSSAPPGGGTFTTPINLKKGDRCAISISGTFVGTVFIQRAYNSTNTMRDVNSYTVPVESGFIADCDMLLQVGVKSGGYASGSVFLEVNV